MNSKNKINFSTFLFFTIISAFAFSNDSGYLQKFVSKMRHAIVHEDIYSEKNLPTGMVSGLNSNEENDEPNVIMTQVTGRVYNDYNTNGSYETGTTYSETGIEGITVMGYGADGTTYGPVLTATDGTYTLPGVTQATRIEFTWDFLWLHPSAAGSTSVQFVAGGASDINLGVIYPSDYCQQNPYIVTNCYVNGAVNSGGGVDDVLVRWSYENSGFDVMDKVSIASKAELGSTYGLAYARKTEKIYASAFLKRHVGILDNDNNNFADLGAIYEMDETGSPVLWLDVTTLGVNVGSIDDDAGRGLTCISCASTDSDGFDNIGEIGIGDLDINDAETFLYFINLADGNLYTIDIASKTLVGSGTLIPQTQCAVADDARPFALNYHKGDLYIGTLCSAMSTQDNTQMEATVYAYNGSTFTEVINYPIDYNRDPINSQCPTITQWFPWNNTWPTSCTTWHRTSNPQPIFGDIEFIYKDGEEFMVMSFIDRWGHQTGAANHDNTGMGNFDAISGGEILIASFDILTQTAVLENGGSVGGSTASTNQVAGGGPGGGEYYWGDAAFNNNGNNLGHSEIVVGGMLYLPGTGEVGVVAFDPNNSPDGMPNGDGGFQVYDTGGIIFLNNYDGSKADAFRIYVGDSGGAGDGSDAGVFDKANGLGDLELLCNPAPVEIGNLVWNDTNRNGIQDADEQGIPNVNVELYNPTTLSVIATASTDANGNYIFSTATQTNTASFIYGLNLDYGGSYQIRIVNAEGNSQQAALNNLENTAMNSDTSINSDARDSDGTDANTSVISFNLGNPGENNHTYDFGFRMMLPPTGCNNPTIGSNQPTCSNTSGCIGGNTFEDYNCNGIDDTEPKVGGIIVNVYDCNNNLVGTTITDSEGDWAVCSLTDGTDYRIEFVLPSEISCWAAPTHVAGSGNQSDVQFLTTPACTQFSVSNPANYSQTNPPVATTCYISGDPLPSGSAAGTDIALLAFPNNSSGIKGEGGTSADTYAISSEIGTTYGLAYKATTKDLFVSAFLKRHSGLGPDGLGAIYKYNTDTGNTTLFSDLTSFGIDFGTVPSNSARGLSTDPTDPSTDAVVFPLIYKAGIGDLDISDDNQHLFLSNLHDRKIYQLSIDDIENSTSGYTPTSYDIPSISCNAGEARPFGLKYYRGKLYVGITCTGENGGSTSDIVAYVYTLDIASGAWSSGAILTIPLDYNKGAVKESDQRNNQPWSDDQNDFTFNGFINFPQAILADIEIDAEGSMHLGIRDRTGDMTGFANSSPNGSTTTGWTGNSGGDVLRAYYDGTSHTLENNGTAGPYTSSGTAGGTNNGVFNVYVGPGGANSQQGPGDGEFYWEDYFYENASRGYVHSETSLGALGHLYGSDEIILNVYDPLDGRFFAGGTHWYNINDGSKRTENYEIFNSGFGANDDNGITFAKANGLGDLEYLSNAAPLEIGNYVWCDSLENGIQDACERGINGITVQLYDRNGALVGVTQTSNNGQYYFNETNVDTTGVTAAGAANTAYTGMSYSTQYFIVFGDGQFASSEFTVGSEMYGITSVVNTGSNDNIDSDVNGNSLTAGSLGARPNGLPFIDMTTSSTGCGDHKYDLGVTCMSCDNPTLTVNAAQGTCTNATANNDATINLSSVTNGDVANYSTGATYTGSAYGGAGEINVSSGSGSFASLAHNTQYTVRVFNGANDCFTDETITTPSITCAVTTYSLGNRVFYDDDISGNQNGTENGIDGITLQLLNANGTLYDSDASTSGVQSLTVTTANDGYYRFDDLPAGDYIVEIVSSTFTSGGLLETYSSTNGAAQEASPNADGDLNDNGLDTPVSGAIRSGVVSLGGTEPISEAEPASYGVGSTTGIAAADTESNLTVDFGFYRQRDRPDCCDPNRPPCGEEPCHFISNNIYFGSGVTNDAGSSSSAGADTDIDDGLVWGDNINAAPGGSLNIPVEIYNTTGSNAYFRMWIDWNGDGDFEDASEQVADEVLLSAVYNGTFTINQQVNIPANATSNEDLALRMRLSTDDTNTTDPCGNGNCADDGEIEDYLLRVNCKTNICLPVILNINR